MKKIAFMLLPLVIFMLAFRPVESHTVSGFITDDAGNPLPSATVMMKGSVIGVASAQDGSYSIVVPNKNGTLVYSMVGMTTQEVKIKGRSKINIVLKSGVAQLSEVVVTGYGMMRKRDLSYATPPVSFNPSGQYQQSLSGKIAGLMITSSSNNNVNNGWANNSLNTESYDAITENSFLKAADNPLSTFSIDVDAASYSNVRRFLRENLLPPAGAVRIEEMINYFKYDYPAPGDESPFSINTEISDAPWNKDHKLVLIGLQGKKIPMEELPASNLVFLVDVSGSMQGPNRLGLVKASMKLLVDQLRDQDRVSMVVYAGAAGLVLPPTMGTEKRKIKDAIDNLEAGGTTAGGQGIRLAYKTAREYYMKNGNNRVILCTDGDFNVGASSDDEMERLIEEERKSGVYLTVLGYGVGNYKDSKMQKLADKGNGNHAYIDDLSEARKVLVNEFGGTLFTIAKDVKLQVEFNPAKVQGYRLIGYENRMLAKEDFNDDKKDAGELGSGHTVTALYEVIPIGIKSDFLRKVDTLKYQLGLEPFSESPYNDELLTVKFRYKAPEAETSKLIEHPVTDDHKEIGSMSDNFRFAAAVAEFGMLLRNSEYRSAASFGNVARMAKKAKGKDEDGYRAEFLKLVAKAQQLSNEKAEEEEETGSQ